MYDRLSQRSPVICGINQLSLALWQVLDGLGVEHLSLADAPTLRNPKYFDLSGNLISDRWPGPDPVAADQLAAEATDCLIATSDFGGRSLLLEWNRHCIDRGIHFLPVALQDMLGYVGPLVVPGDTPCLRCLHMRQNAHLREPELEQLMEEEAQRGISISSAHPAMISVLANWAAFELIHFYGEFPHRRPGKLIEIAMAQGQTRTRTVLKIPRCPDCSKLNRTASVRIESH